MSERDHTDGALRKSAEEQMVSVTLSSNQVDHVVRAALGDGAAPSMSSIVAGGNLHHSFAGGDERELSSVAGQ